MPIVEEDPWREQYFEDVACPEGVVVPTDDVLAYRLYPEHRWVYDKLRICATQGLEHAPHGIEPGAYPVFSKPIYNLRGMGTGGQVIESATDFARKQAPGHLWMPLLEGEHVSTDVAVVEGEAAWWRHTLGLETGGGTFDYWTVLAERRPALEEPVGRWIRENLPGYTGVMNIETIGGTIIEAHLRFADQWPDLYGRGWLDALVTLYADGRWGYADDDRRTGYSVVLFGRRRPRRRLSGGVVESLRQRPAISSVQITFHPDRPAGSHAMPPGGFRLAVINCWELEAGTEARAELAEAFAGPAGPPERDGAG